MANKLEKLKKQRRGYYVLLEHEYKRVADYVQEDPFPVAQVQASIGKITDYRNQVRTVTLKSSINSQTEMKTQKLTKSWPKKKR